MALRVAQVVGKMVGGGMEAVVMNYYRHIDRDKVQFDLLVDSDSTLVPADAVEALGGRIIEVPPYQNQPTNSLELERLFRKEGWQIVHSHMNTLSVFPLRAAKCAGVPVRIAHSHSTWGKGEYKRNVLKALLRTQANRYPTHRLACSKYAGEWLFGKSADFEVLYNAVELGRFFFDAEARAHARADLGLVGDTFAIGHVGRFVPQKNHQFLIEAFAELVKLRPDSVLLCVGSGETEASVERSAAERGVADKVRLLGQRGDVNRLYQAFDAFALPSLYEGLGLVGVEAQEAGLPCFLSDTITREVNVTGAVRFLPIDDPKIWAEELARVPFGPTRESTAKDFALYDIEQQAPWLAEFYCKALAEVAR